MTNNKANKSKILALILGLTMCISLMLGIVFASPTNTVYAAGTTFECIEINGDKDVTSTDGTYKYTASDKTLILKNYNGGQFRLNDDATIVLQGNNTITVDKTSKKFGSSSYPYYAGIDSNGAITITGSGSLAINVETSDVKERCYGIGVENGMTINGGIPYRTAEKQMQENIRQH